MIKFSLLLVLFGVSILLGYQTAKVYKDKNKFYQDVLDFSKHLKSEISFLKTDLLSILNKYHYSSVFEKIKNEICDLYKNNQNIEVDKIKDIIKKNIDIDEAILNNLSQLFFELGRLGYVEELERLEYYIDYFSEISKKKNERADKMIPFCKKMSILLGLLVCIVLI